MKDLIIKKAKKEDLNQIMKIYSESVVDEFKTQYPKKTKKEIFKYVGGIKKIFKNFNKEIKSKKDYWIIAEFKNKIIGFAFADIFNRDGWLRMNYLNKDFRKKGIGKKLTERRIDWFKKQKIKNIYAQVFVKNDSSIKNLKKFKFIPSSIIYERSLE